MELLFFYCQNRLSYVFGEMVFRLKKSLKCYEINANRFTLIDMSF